MMGDNQANQADICALSTNNKILGSVAEQPQHMDFKILLYYFAKCP